MARPNKVSAVEEQTDGVLGVAVIDLKTGHEWSLRGQERFAPAGRAACRPRRRRGHGDGGSATAGEG